MIGPLNNVGACAEFREDYENDLLKEVKGDFIFHAWLTRQIIILRQPIFQFLIKMVCIYGIIMNWIIGRKMINSV